VQSSPPTETQQPDDPSSHQDAKQDEAFIALDLTDQQLQCPAEKITAGTYDINRGGNVCRQNYIMEAETALSAKQPEFFGGKEAYMP
jgi:hypothetical protein